MSDPCMLPAEQVKTVCYRCSNYQMITLSDRHCLKAKPIGIDRVTGETHWESNYEKNDGNCPDFEERPEPKSQQIPPGITVTPEAGPAPRRSIWDRISDAWSELIA